MDKTKLIYLFMLITAFALAIAFQSAKASAADWDNKKIYLSAAQTDSKYGKIEIYDSLLMGIGYGNKLADVVLHYNTDQCLIDCYSEGEITLYSTGSLFSNIKLYNEVRDNVKDVSIKFYYGIVENYIEYIDEYESICSNILDKSNGTSYESCVPVVSKQKEVSKQRINYKEYKGELLSAGKYKWRIEGQKKPSQRVDWIATIQGVSLDEWAWWDNSWKRRREIKIQDTSGTSSLTLANYSIRLNVTYVANMKNDFSDIRFLDSTNSIELGYWNESQANGASAIFWVRVPQLTANTNTSIYMYYNNSLASSNQNRTLAFLLFTDWDSLTGWDCTGASTCSVSGSQLTLTGAGNLGIINTLSNYTNVSIITRSDATGTNPVVSVYARVRENVANAIANGYFSYHQENNGDNSLNRRVSSTNSLLAQNTTGTWTTHKRYQFNLFHNILNATRMEDSNSTTPSGIESSITNNTDSNFSIGYVGLRTTATDKSIVSDWFQARPFTQPEPTSVFGPEESQGVVLVSPTNDAAFNSQPIFFNATVSATSPATLTQANLTIWYSNGSIFAVNSTLISGTTNNTFWTQSGFVDGTYLWNVLRCDTTPSCIFADTNNTFIFDTAPPEISISQPIDTINYHRLNTNLSVNWTVVNNLSAADSCRVEYGPFDSFEDGDNNWTFNKTAPAFDSLRTNEYAIFGRFSAKMTSFAGVGGGFGFIEKRATRTGILTFSGNITTLLDLDNNPSIKVDVNGINVASVPSNITIIRNINVTVNSGDLVRIYPESTFGFNNRLYVDEIRYVGDVRQFVVCSSNSTQINVTIANSKTLKFYANDTAGNLGTRTKTWEYNLLEISRGFKTTALETSSEIFTINATYPDDRFQTISSRIIYEGVPTESITIKSGQSVNSSARIDLPVGSGQRTFLWSFDLTNTSGTFNINTTSSTQTIDPIFLVICNSTISNVTLNFTAYDEVNISRINPFTFAGTFKFWVGSGVFKKNATFDNSTIAERTICISPTNITFFTDAQIEYNQPNPNITYITRNYYFQNHTINGTKQDVFLFLLRSALSTSFIQKVQNTDLTPVKGVLILTQRFYPGSDQFRTVQISKTDDNGKSIGFYQTETVDYRHIIRRDGRTLLTTNQQKIFGEEVPFTLLFTVGEVPDVPWEDFLANPNLTVSLTYDQPTKKVTYTYSDASGQTTAGRLFVRILNATGPDVTACDINITGVSGSAICDLTSFNGTFVAQGFTSKSPEKIASIISGVISSALGSGIADNSGLLLGYFIILTAAFAFIWDPTSGVIAVNAAMIFTNLVGLTVFSPVFLFGIAAISIFIVVMMKT